MNDALDSRDLGEWMAYYGLEPFGGVRGDIQAAVVAYTVASAAPFRQSGKQFELSDFMPFKESESREMTVEDLERTARRIMAMQNEAFRE